MRRFDQIVGTAGGCIVLGGLLAAAWLGVVAPGASADQVACGQVVTTSVTLDGGLTGCAGDGLVIGAGGVTVDLNGQTIEGVGLGVGVRNDGYDGVTIRNGTVKKFDYGIALGTGTDGSDVTGVTLAQNEWASIQLDGASGNRIDRNHISEYSDVGVLLVNQASGNLLAQNTVEGGNGEAFVVEGGSNSNRLEANTILGSSDNAVRVDSSSNTLVLSNLVAGGSDVAVMMSAAPGSVVQANTVIAPGDAAILLSDSTSSVVRFNQLSNSQDAGVILSTVADSLVKGNAMSQVGDAAIVLRNASDGNRVIDNEAYDSSDAGIFIGDGVSNTVRGNALIGGAVGIELSGGQDNRLEFNVANASKGLGVEISESAGNVLFGNTINNNLGGGLWVEPIDGASGNHIARNAANWNGGRGMSIGDPAAVVTGNLASNNLGWGNYAVGWQVDGGGNGASGNAEPAQCYLIACSDGADWQAPVRPPEQPDPLETGLPPARWAPPPPSQPWDRFDEESTPAGLGGSRTARRRGGRRARLGVVRCKRRRAGSARARVICRAPYRATPTGRRVSGRLVRGGKSYARGARGVRAGGRGSLAMRARKHPKAGRYVLLLRFRGVRGHTTLVRRGVVVR